MDYRKIYDLETYLNFDVKTKFMDTGIIESLDFYLILIWKSPRAKTRARDRLKSIAGSFSKAVGQIGHALHGARDPKERLQILMITWKFRLPTATAILTMLYPTDFTVYDVRVVEQLNDFRKLGYMIFSDNMWKEYLRYTKAVDDNAPNGLSLRDKDRYFWGKSLHEQCLKEIAE
jgi:hypothetical protein